MLRLPREGTDPETRGLPLLRPSALISKPLLGCSSKAMCPQRRKPPRRLHNPVYVILPKPGRQQSPSCHQGIRCSINEVKIACCCYNNSEELSLYYSISDAHTTQTSFFYSSLPKTRQQAETDLWNECF